MTPRGFLMAVKTNRLGTQGAFTHHRGGVDWCRPTVRHSWAGQTVVYMILMLSNIRYPVPSSDHPTVLSTNRIVRPGSRSGHAATDATYTTCRCRPVSRRAEILNVRLVASFEGLHACAMGACAHTQSTWAQLITVFATHLSVVLS